jgi:hypothetical protein
VYGAGTFVYAGQAGLNMRTIHHRCFPRGGNTGTLKRRGCIGDGGPEIATQKGRCELASRQEIRKVERGVGTNAL